MPKNRELATGPWPVVLVVEDDEHLRRILTLTLTPLDLVVRTASNLSEAREQLRKARPALVIIDFYLKPEAGTDLLDDVPHDVPVLLLTASLEIAEIQRKHPRIAAALTKPIDHERLHAVVLDLVRTEA
jgi:DNA-binding NtrC family response regulator